MKNRFHPLRSEGAGKTIIGLALVSLSALPVLCLYPRDAAIASAPPNTRLHAKELKQRATRSCTALGAPNPTIGEPEFVVENFDNDALSGQRRLWVVDCLAGSHGYTLIFNDLTGNVQSLYSDGTTSSFSSAAVPNPVLTSPSDALEVSIRRLQDLQMAPKGTRIALAQRPRCDRDRTIWRVAWKVTRPGAADPYEVRMALSARDATPLTIVNCNELGQFAPD